MMLFNNIKRKILFLKKNKRQEVELYEKSLNKSSHYLSSKLNFLENNTIINDDFYNKLEEALIMSDVSYKTTKYIIENLKKIIKKNKNIFDKELLINIIINIVANQYKNISEHIPKILIIGGVNGVGKTTSIAKLANFYLEQSLQTLVIAADTFRSGAIEQITKWCQDYEIPCFVPARKQKDPASVIYSGIEYANIFKHEYIICDTAGRMHIDKNLMLELKKIKKIVDKKTLDNQFYLVIDGTLGQNSLQQVSNFVQYLKIDGIILTKMDGLAKGGIVLSLCHEYNIPIKYIGLGEKINDLKVFDFKLYLYSLLKELVER